MDLTITAGTCLWAVLIAATLGAAIAFAFNKLVTTLPSYPQIPKGPGNPSHRIIVVDFPQLPGVAASMSPFVTKVEAALRFAGVDYGKKHASLEELRAAPKGQLPYILHGPNLVADSSFIIKYLARTFGAQVQDVAAPKDLRSRAVALAVQEMVEGELYQGYAYFKYGANWAHTAAQLRPLLRTWYRLPPVWPVAAVALLSLRAKLYNAAVAQGIARHSEEDVRHLLAQDLSALSSLLGDRPFLLGPAPCGADASLFGLLDVVLHDGMAPQLATMVREQPNLVQYAERIRHSYFSAAYCPTLVPVGDPKGMHIHSLSTALPQPHTPTKKEA